VNCYPYTFTLLYFVKSVEIWQRRVVVPGRSRRGAQNSLIKIFYDNGTKSGYQGWVFAMAKTIFAVTVEKTGKKRGKNRQKLAKSKTS